MTKHKTRMILVLGVLLCVGVLLMLPRLAQKDSAQLIGQEESDRVALKAAELSVAGEDLSQTSEPIPETTLPVLSYFGIPLSSKAHGIVNSAESPTATDTAVLAAFLLAPVDERNPEIEHLRSLADKTLKFLRSNPPPGDELERLFIQVLSDSRQDPAIRDYCLQHLGEWYPHAQRKDWIRRTLAQSLRERSGTIAGSALLALQRISRTSGDVDEHSVMLLALDIANDPAAGTASRMTALRLCGEGRIPDALPLASAIAEGDENTAMRVAAISTLGDIGAKEQILMLRALSESPNSSIAHAAGVALQRISKRTGVHSNG